MPNPGDALWAGYKFSVNGSGIATDASGNIYVSGWNLNTQILVSKYSPPNQIPVWNWISSGTTAVGFGYAIAIGKGLAASTLFVAVGDQPGGVGVFPYTFLRTISTDGVPGWYKINSVHGESPGTQGAAASTAVIVDGNGDIIVTGKFWGTVDFGNDGTHVVTGSSMALSAWFFIAKYNSSGTILWLQTVAPTSGYLQGYALGYDASNNVYVAGQMAGSSTLGAFTIDDGGLNSPWVSILNSGGGFDNAKSFHQNNSAGAAFLSINVASDGSMVAAGPSTGTINFGGADVFGGFMVRLSSSLNHIWSLSLGNVSTGWAKPKSMAVDSKGNMVITGQLFGSFDFGTGKLSSGGNSSGNMFMAEYLPNGSSPPSISWARCFLTTYAPYASYGFAVAIDPNNNPIFVTAAPWSICFDAICPPSGQSGGNDQYIVELSGSGGQTISPPNPADFTAVYAPSSNTSFQSKFGFNWTGSLPAGASNILIKYLFPTGTIFPTPNVETTPFLLLNYVSTYLYNGKTAYGFVFKVTGGNGPIWNIPFGYTTIQDWQWAAAWANSTGAQLGSYTAWQPVTRTAAVNLTNDGNVANTPYANLKTTTLQTIKGPMQIVS